MTTVRRFTTQDSLVTCSVEDDIALLALNCPDKLNALTEPMGNALVERVHELSKMSALRAVVLTGNGRAFSAGGDLNWLLQRHGDEGKNNAQIMKAFYKRFLCLRDLSVPVIGAINGPAIGAGLCLAVGACDLRVASHKATMGFTFVKLGLHPGMAATHFAPLLLGPAVAADLLLTGRVIEAEEALKLGLVGRVCPDPLREALELAKEISLGAPQAVKTTLETLRRRQNATGLSLEAAMQRESEAQAETYATQDLAEGVRALQEKRPPKFTGK